MKVTIGEAGLTKTFQDVFPKTTKCCRCGGKSRIGFVAHDGDEGDKQEFLRTLHENEGKGGYWLHDAASVAVYFCRECLEPTALYNQG
jgi:hypothetical protein